MVRSTYANFKNSSSNYTENWSLFFVLALPNNNSNLTLVESESKHYGDIVIANISDTYQNLTLKTLVGIKVASCFCPNAEYVIKTDDDVYLLPKKFEQVLSHLSGKTYFVTNFQLQTSLCSI